MTTTRSQQVEATPQNINDAILHIGEYAKSKGYVFNEKDVPEFRENSLAFWQGIKLEFGSKSKMKVCRNYLTRLDKNITMGTANRFLHFIWRHVMKKDGNAPRVEFSATEQKIRASKKAWRTAQAESDRLLLEYKALKGDFYKK